MGLKQAFLRKAAIKVRQILIIQLNLSLRKVLVAGIATLANRPMINVPSTRVDSAALAEGEI